MRRKMVSRRVLLSTSGCFTLGLSSAAMRPKDPFNTATFRTEPVIDDAKCHCEIYQLIAYYYSTSGDGVVITTPRDDNSGDGVVITYCHDDRE